LDSLNATVHLLFIEVIIIKSIKLMEDAWGDINDLNLDDKIDMHAL